MDESCDFLQSWEELKDDKDVSTRKCDVQLFIGNDEKDHVIPSAIMISETLRLRTSGGGSQWDAQDLPHGPMALGHDQFFGAQQVKARRIVHSMDIPSGKLT